MSAAIRLEVAAEALAAMPDKELRRLSDSDAVWNLSHRVGVPFFKMERLIKRERFRRGLIQLADLPPHERRELMDPATLDLHALASGPIMDSNQIYLPAGKISLAEAKAREAQGILSATKDGGA